MYIKSLCLVAECLPQLAITENRELFILNPQGIINHFPSGLCVVLENDRKLKLDDCWSAQTHNDGRNNFIFHEDGSIIPEFNTDECIHIPTDSGSSNLALKGKPESTSSSGDGGHEAIRAIGNYKF